MKYRHPAPDTADDEDHDLSLTAAMSHRAHDRRNPEARRPGHSPAPRPTAAGSDLNDPRGDFETTYRPARFEKEWLREALRPFYDQRLIVDVLTQVRGGKEANVYCCRAHPELGGGLVAAKVYRPQRFRNLRNDAIYRENRSVLTGAGQPVSALDARTHRALAKKTDCQRLMPKGTSLQLRGMTVLRPTLVRSHQRLADVTAGRLTPTRYGGGDPPAADGPNADCRPGRLPPTMPPLVRAGVPDSSLSPAGLSGREASPTGAIVKGGQRTPVSHPAGRSSTAMTGLSCRHGNEGCRPAGRHSNSPAT